MNLRSWLHRLTAPRAASPAPWNDFWYEAVASPTESGVDVSSDTAMRTSAVYACVRVRSDAVGSVGLHVYDRSTRERAKDHPLYRVLHDAPNHWQTPYEFKQFLQACVDLRGNAYALIVPGRRGWVSELHPMNPDRVRLLLTAEGRLIYEHTNREGKTQRLLQGEVLHLRGMTFDGYLGVTPITYARETIGRQLAMERANARFHKNDASPRVAIRHPGVLKEDGHKRLKESWNSSYGGYGNAHRAAILEEGMEVQVLGLKPEDAQFVESWEGGITDICRWFGVHPRKLYAKSGDSQTYTNVESASIEYLTDTGLPLFTRFEQCADRDLLLPSERGRFYTEFLVDSLQRADSAARAAFYEKALNGRWMTRNEIRARENLPPLDDGDDFPLPAPRAPEAVPGGVR